MDTSATTITYGGGDGANNNNNGGEDIPKWKRRVNLQSHTSLY